MKHTPPQRGLTTEALITRVIDGDTVEIQPLQGIGEALE